MIFLTDDSKGNRNSKGDRHLRNRIDFDGIWVLGFDDRTTCEFCDYVFFQANDNPNQPILIYINTYGGSADNVLAMLSALDSVPNPVITVCVGKAMSAGAILLSHGDVRYAAPYSRIMLHEISTQDFGNVNDVCNDANESFRLNDQVLSLLAKNCGYKNAQEFQKLFTNKRREIYLTPDQAIKFGIADKVGIPRVIRGEEVQVIENKIKEQRKGNKGK